MAETQLRGSESARPGAMTMAMKAVEAPSAERVLRVGVLRNGTIVEERVIRERETVTVGSSEKNHFIIPRVEGMPSRFPLFEIAGKDYVLNFDPRMTGRVALPGGVQRLDDLRTAGGARDAGGYHQIKLTDQSRGKVVIGDTTILFQFVNPPPPPPKPMLPASVRGGFGTSIDWTFTSFIVASFLLFFGSGLMLESIDPVVEVEEAVLPPQFARLLFVEPQVPEEPEEIESEEGEETTAVDEAPVKAPSKVADASPKGPPSSSAERAEATARIVASVGARAESLIMGVLGDGGGALSDALAHGAVTANALDVLASAAGVQHADGASAGQIRAGTGGGGSGQTGSLGQIAGSAQAGKQITTRGPVEKQVTGKVGAARGTAIGGTGEFDANLVLTMVKNRMSAIKSCYDRALRTNPTAAGRVKVEFTIQPNGTVSGARAVENTTGSDEVASCVVSTVERFRFNPGPQGGSVTFSYPFVFQLQD